MSSNIDHEALVQQQIEEEKKDRILIEKQIQKDEAEMRSKDSYFVRQLEAAKQENSNKKFQINSKPNIEVITVDKPYKLEEIRDFKTPELKEKVKRVKDEDIEEYLKELSVKNADNARLDSIYLEALKYGTQSGLYNRSKQLQKFIDKYESEFSRIFNFQPLLLANGRVVPAVIVESKNNIQNESRYTLRMTDRSYKIEEQVSVVNTPITWRQYLVMDAITPVLPDDMLLPLNEKEDHYWKLGVTQGWETGVGQANSIYLEKIRILERDYIGMVRFHLMLKRGLVTNPITSTVSLGVTGTQEDMNVNEVLFNIDQAAKFNKEAETWRALPELPDFITPDPFQQAYN